MASQSVQLFYAAQLWAQHTEAEITLHATGHIYELYAGDTG